MTAIEIFRAPTGQDIRTVVLNDEPWFMANDVCAILDIANVGNALARLDEDERSSIRLTDGTPGNPNRAIVSEAGLYDLIVRSDKPEAKAFRRWVTHEVLPQIRKTGGYSVAVPKTLPEALRAYAAEVESHEQTRAELAAAEPKAEAWDVLASAEGDYSARDAANILNRDPNINTGQNRLFGLLRDLGMTDKLGRPYAKHSNHLRLRATSYTDPWTGEEKTKTQIRITPDGVRYLHKRLGGTRQPAFAELVRGVAS